MRARSRTWTAAANDSAETRQTTAVTINVLANDSDGDGTLDPAAVAVQCELLAALTVTLG